MDVAGEQPYGRDVDAEQGTAIGRPAVPGYELLTVLGTGAGGPVWRARRSAPFSDGASQDVALKVVRGGAHAERELAVLRAVRHEHVVRLRDSVPLPDGSIALVLDLVEGGTLAQLVTARGHLRPGEVVTVVAPLASTLAELHAAGIQHGDLAPGNVLFDAGGRPMLADLGTVRVTGEARDEQFGTPGYVDPVVVAGGLAGPASDVYGLGALAWFALTGRTPPGALVREPLAGVVPGLPEALVAAVEEALDPDPARRPDPASLARRVYDAAPPEPVWLVGNAPVDGGLTHRIRRLAADDAALAPPRHRGTRVRQAPWRRRPGTSGSTSSAPGSSARPARVRRATAIGAVVVGALVLLLGWAVLAPSGDGSTGEPSSHEVAGAVVSTTPAAAAARLGVEPRRAALAAPSTPARSSSDEAGGAGGAARLTDAQAEEVVQHLSAGRADAFVTGDASVLDRVTVPGSPADRLARAAVAGLREQGVVYRGLVLRTRSAQVRSTDGSTVVVDVVTDVSAYDVVDARGTVRQRSVARPGTTSSLVLLATRQGWRVQDVRG